MRPCDRSSFAHGVPAHIREYDHDVPIPSLEELITPGNPKTANINAAKCFVKLCTLTVVLAEILPLLYDRRSRPRTEISRTLHSLEIQLESWEESLPEWMKIQNDSNTVTGSSSLKLGFLSTKMLLRRIAFHASRICSYRM